MDVEDVVAAKRFVLVDDQGARRAVLKTEPNGLVGLLVFGKGGGSSGMMITVGVADESGVPAVMVRRAAPDGGDFGSVILSVTEEGRAAIHLEDADGTRRNLLANE
jgi:hypothetical protein